MQDTTLSRKQYHALRRYIKSLAHIDAAPNRDRALARLDAHEQDLLSAFSTGEDLQHNNSSTNQYGT